MEKSFSKLIEPDFNIKVAAPLIPKKIPNILTIGRVIIVPFFVLAFYLPGFYGDLTALILFIIASFTDFLDGMLARFLGQESKLGELLDPIADKILVAAALILLVMNGTLTLRK